MKVDYDKPVNVERPKLDMVKGHPKLERGQVWCHRCGATRKVDSAKCLATGWPECCGETMSIDKPGERGKK